MLVESKLARTGSKLGLIFKTGTGVRSYLFEELDPQLDCGFPVPKHTTSHQWKDMMARYYKNWRLDICENCNHTGAHICNSLILS